MKRIRTFVFTAILAVLACIPAVAKPTELDIIKYSGALRVGVKNDVPKFSYFDPQTKQYTGLEIDLAKEIAKKLFGSDDHIEFVPVTAKTSGPFLKNNRIDIVVATFSVTDERKAEYEFSDVYFTDAIGIMVKKESGITSFRELENKTIGVAQGTLTKIALRSAAIKEGITIKTQDYANCPQIKASLDAGEIEAFGVDQAILFGYLDDTTALLPERFDELHYAVAIKKDNVNITKLVNEVIHNLIKTGELDKLLEKNGLKG